MINPRNPTLTDAVNSRLSESELKMLEEAVSIKPKISHDPRKFLDAVTFQPTKLEGDALSAAIKEKTVISIAALRNRALVNARTGQPTDLSGAALQEAIDKKIVVTLNTYHRNRFVDPSTGKTTKLSGVELEMAIVNKTVITINEYKQQLAKTETDNTNTLFGQRKRPSEFEEDLAAYKQRRQESNGNESIRDMIASFRGTT